jgi:hypothetical protein
MLNLNSTLTSLEGCFSGCTGISGSIWRDFFAACPNLTTIKEAFSGVGLSGIFFSR